MWMSYRPKMIHTMIWHIYLNRLKFTLGQKAERKLSKLGSREIQVPRLYYNPLGHYQLYIQYIHLKKIHDSLLTIHEGGNDLE